MKSIHIFAVTVLTALGATSLMLPSHPAAQPVSAQPVTARIGPTHLYPNPSLTTGSYDTLSVTALTARYKTHCPSGKATCTYSQSHRYVPKSEHEQVYDEYNVPAMMRNIDFGEVDHLYPLCAGGSNDISNLWYQPAHNIWNGASFGFHEKDDLETWVCAQIKAGALDPRVAYQKITTDWVRYYLEVHPAHPAHQDFGE